MKFKTLIAWSSALCLSGGLLQAQDANSTEKLEQKLKAMQEHFEKLIQDQQREIEALKKQVATTTIAAPAAATTNAVMAEQLEE